MSRTGAVCNAQLLSVEILQANCSTCKTKVPMLAEYYAFYGPRFTCLHCGEAWNDHEQAERPFTAGWRGKRVREALDRLFLHIDRYGEFFL